MKLIRLISIFVVLLFSLSVTGQIKVSETSFDLGDLYLDDSRFVDVQFSNKGSKKEWLLSVKKPREVVYLFDSKWMEPDSSILLRLQANPTEKGRFNYDIPVYLSDRQDPVLIEIKGNLKELPQNTAGYLQSCPDFGSTPGQVGKTVFELTVQVRDSITNEPVRNSTVKVYRGYNQSEEYTTNRNGIIELESTPGPLYFTANAGGYYNNEDGDYFNFRRNRFTIKLLPRKEVIVEELEDEEVVTVVIDENEEENTEVVEENDSTNDPETIEDDPLPGLENIPLNDFSDKYFKPVNIVFVVDISSSMKSRGKIQLLKKTMHDFIDILRPSDKVTIVAFATETSVIMETTKGQFKSTMHEKIESIEPRGSTAGSEGVKLGYKNAKNAYLEQGNNQVVIVTDGGFNRGDTKYKRIIRREKRRRGIEIAVVGIKNNDFNAERLKEVAELGNGDFFSIQTLDDASSSMIEQVRRKAYRGVID